MNGQSGFSAELAFRTVSMGLRADYFFGFRGKGKMPVLIFTFFSGRRRMTTWIGLN
jgi:hypothetical protein